MNTGGTGEVFMEYVRGLEWLPAALDNQGRPTQTRALATCPNCQTKVSVFVWSLSGGGKRCHGCRALLTSLGAWVKKTEGTRT